MTGGLEGVGEAVTGGLVARSVEPEAGEARGEPGGACLNCGTSLIGPHCHCCGQSAHVHRTLAGFGHDLAHSVFHFDGKMWRTLPLLAWRPGDLTRRYIAGERASFVSPMALFLFSVFLMFAVFSSLGGPFGSNVRPHSTPEGAAGIARESQALERQIAGLESRRRALKLQRQPTAALDAEIRSLRQQLEGIEAVRSIVVVPSSAPEGPKKTIDLSDVNPRTSWPWLNHAIDKAKANPSLLAYKLQSSAYKFSWALIPISVPFLWLLFLHRRRYRRYTAYDHTVFVTYSIAFMSLGLVALSLLRLVGLPTGAAVLAFVFVPPFHIYRQLRGAYELSRLSALWRTLALVVLAFVAAGFFFALLLTLGVLG
ncbi:MAG: DUF3667 domain-containing protein [Allosphingosinicella sp.]